MSDIIDKNPSLKDSSFYILRGFNSTAMQTSEGIDVRPYPIMAATLLGPEEYLPYTMDNRNFTVLEFGALQTGVVFTDTFTYNNVSYATSATEVVGGLIDSFVFATNSSAQAGIPVGLDAAHIGQTTK